MIIGGSVSVAAGGVSGNVLADYSEALLLHPNAVALRVSVNGAALNNDIVCKFAAGTQPVLGLNGVGTNPAVAAGKIDPRTDTLYVGVVAGKLRLDFESNAAGALVVNWQLEFAE